jgi:hypothetical protein
MLTEGLRVESYLTTAQPFACFQIYLRVNWKTEENRSSALSEQRRTNILMSNLSMVQAVESMKKRTKTDCRYKDKIFSTVASHIWPLTFIISDGNLVDRPHTKKSRGKRRAVGTTETV